MSKLPNPGPVLLIFSARQEFDGAGQAGQFGDLGAGAAVSYARLETCNDWVARTMIIIPVLNGVM
ncbi:MAG: hypothetical protein J2P19_08620 [Pseudonocardia sp.]|nr:hypothetical protein [Pseudonocardia sp.]